MAEVRAARVAFVTGASSGFGAAIARHMAARGDRVVIAARRLERLEALADDLGHGIALPIQLDMRDGEAIDDVVTSLPPDFKPIDVLVNNAGLALGLGSAADADFAE